MEYSAGLMSKLFWLRESRKTAGYILEGYSKADIKKIAWMENIYQVLFNVLLGLMQKNMQERTNLNISWYSISFRLSPAMRQRKRRFTVY